MQLQRLILKLFTILICCISNKVFTFHGSARNANAHIVNTAPFRKTSIRMYGQFSVLRYKVHAPQIFHISNHLITFHGRDTNAYTFTKNCSTDKCHAKVFSISSVTEFKVQKLFKRVLSVIPHEMHRHYKETDSYIIFLSKEKHQLCIPNAMYGLSPLVVINVRSISVPLYACAVLIELISYYLKVLLFKHRLRCMKKLSSRVIIRKSRQCIAIFRHKALLHMAAEILLLLLLCGDIHPNPGPVLPGSTRHPHLQLLTVGAWNVRTLLETKRTHTHTP